MKRRISLILISCYVGGTGSWIAWDLWHRYVLDWRWCK